MGLEEGEAKVELKHDATWDQNQNQLSSHFKI